MLNDFFSVLFVVVLTLIAWKIVTNLEDVVRVPLFKKSPAGIQYPECRMASSMLAVLHSGNLHSSV